MKKLIEELTKEIEKAYESTPTIEEAEKLAAKFIYAQLILSQEYAASDLDRRMRKRGVKSIRSAVRTEEIKKYDKKPTESVLDDAVNLNELVAGEEASFDQSEVNAEELGRLLGIFKEAHVYFRQLSKGGFNG